MDNEDIKTFSRRKFLSSTTAAVAVPAVSGSFFIGGVARAQAPVTVNMLAWYGHAEPDVVAEFEAQNNCKIKAKYYTGGDNMLALISQSPVGTYDLILSDAEYVPQLQKAGYIEKLNPKDYPFDDFFPEFQKFPGHWQGNDLYSVITRFGFLGVAYNTVMRAIVALEVGGVLAKVGDGKRDRVFCARAILDILDEPARLVPEPPSTHHRKSRG